MAVASVRRSRHPRDDRRAATLAPSVVYPFGLLPLGLTLVLADRRTTPVDAVSPVGSVAR